MSVQTILFLRCLSVSVCHCVCNNLFEVFLWHITKNYHGPLPVSLTADQTGRGGNYKNINWIEMNVFLIKIDHLMFYTESTEKGHVRVKQNVLLPQVKF